jgi:putative endonuclease
MLQPLARMSSDPRQTLGELGETLACDELRRRGYAILERRYRTRYGEIDIVARHGDVLVFVEVKARAGVAFGSGAEAVTRWKQRRVAQMAADFLVRRRLQDRPCRFDVVSVAMGDGAPRIEVIAGAFVAAGH